MTNEVTPVADEPISNPPVDPVSPPTPDRQGDVTPTEPTADTPPAEEPKKVTKTLLDDEDEPAAEPKPEDAQTPNDEAIDAFIKGIDATDLGDGVQWSDETLKAMAPSLMEITGGDAKKANGVVKAYAAHMQEQARKQTEAMEAFNDGLIKECQTRFGADLKKVAGLAREGGRAIFGDNLWSALKATPAFANNPDVLERLAEHGRRIREDNGAVATKTAEQKEEGDLFKRMYGGIK